MGVAADRCYFDNRNRADTDDLIGRFPDSDEADVEAAVRSANKASRSGPARRCGDARRAGDLLVERKLIATVTAARWQSACAEGDVQEGIDTAYYAATEGRWCRTHRPLRVRSKP